MDRRRFFVATGAMAASPLLPWIVSVNIGSLARGNEVGSNLRELTAPGGGDNRATFMPSGETILFASKRSGKSQIWAIDPDGREPRRFHESGANDFGRVAPNSDGSQICFSSDRDGHNAVYVVDVASGRLVLVSDPAFWSFGPSWSSRDVIAFFSKKGGNVLNIWTVRPDGSGARQVTDSLARAASRGGRRMATPLLFRPTVAWVCSRYGSSPGMDQTLDR